MSKAVRKQAVVSAKIERHTCAYKYTSFTEELLTAFHFDVSKDCPEIHPPMFEAHVTSLLMSNKNNVAAWSRDRYASEPPLNIHVCIQKKNKY